MFSEQRRREEQAFLAHDYALEQAEEKALERGIERGRAEGIKEGLKVGLVNLVHQGLLTSKVASEQLGMAVAEFEALLQEHHQY